MILLFRFVCGYMSCSGHTAASIGRNDVSSFESWRACVCPLKITRSNERRTYQVRINAREVATAPRQSRTNADVCTPDPLGGKVSNKTRTAAPSMERLCWTVRNNTLLLTSLEVGRNKYLVQPFSWPPLTTRNHTRLIVRAQPHADSSPGTLDTDRELPIAAQYCTRRLSSCLWGPEPVLLCRMVSPSVLGGFSFPITFV